MYALLFADAGLSAGQISLLLAVWSIASFTLEVPSGALADRVSRRHLMAGASLLRAAGFACWLVWPSFTGFAVGFLLWGAKSALYSGTLEALIYDELAAAGATKRYALLIGRSEVAAMLGAVIGTAAAAPLVGFGGYAAAGWVSVAVCVLGAAVPLTLPASAQVRSADGAGLRGYLHTLRTGVTMAARTAVIRRAVLVISVLMGFTVADEYFPLLARELGVTSAFTPVLLLAPMVALAIGAEAAGRLTELRPRTAAWLVVAASAVFVAGTLSGHAAGFVAIAAGYGAVSCVALVADARLQDAIEGPRATITSVSGFGTEVIGVTLVAWVGLGSGAIALPVLIAALAVPAALLGLVLPRWLPAASEPAAAER